MNFRRYSKHLGLILVSITSLSACSKSDHVYYYQRSVLGVDASASTAEQGGGLTVGFRRNFLAYVPTQTNEVTPTEVTPKQSTMSVIACAEVEIVNAFGFDVNEAMATGEAALIYADKVAQGAAGPFSCFQGG
ncbi:hypothetical protein RMQ97_09215 [Maricaulis sp. D1M11]|uniref:hypothetical protein n=1 Tax=Maricaulis sp. D1M11 TaxID=3076117 RepID=UPI0039B6D7E7